jgi:hypothetical protein
MTAWLLDTGPLVAFFDRDSIGRTAVKVRYLGQ